MSMLLFLLLGIVCWMPSVLVLVHGSPSNADSSSTSSSRSPLKPDLITDYILRDLLRSSPSLNNNNHQQQKPRLPRPGWFSNGNQKSPQLSDLSLDDSELKEDPTDQSQITNQLIADLYASLLANSPNQPIDYQQLPQSRPLVIDDGQQDLGWFDGPVLPKVSPILGDYDDDFGGEDTNGGSELNQPLAKPQEEDDQLLANSDDPLIDDRELLNALWTKYLASTLYQTNQDEQVDEQDQSTAAAEPDYQLEEKLLNQLVDKRRMKVIKHEKQSHQHYSTTSTTTELPPQTSTTSTTKKVIQEPNEPKINEKARFLHKASKFSKKQPVKVTMNGQKEYPMLRPASENKKNEDNNEPEWPSELDENTLAEEDSLKQLPKMNKKQQQRPVRDVLTSELNQLKLEQQPNGQKQSKMTNIPQQKK